MTRYITIFSLTLLILFTLELLQPVQINVVEPFTALIAQISVTLISFFDANVISYGKIIQSQTNGFAVSIEPGCNGVEAMIVLTAAVLAFPSSIKQKIAVLVIGFFAIQIMNLGRIISLFYLGQWHTGIFEWAHLYIWPVLIMVDVLIVFLLWMKFLPMEVEVAQDAS